mmetsp:Transcript_58264/g.121011  ORF Transcript_58264/g.121011 Transcript_58264/m.121011 type:complete len:431 (-) Transcript_58264:181-1473(-)
MGAGGGVLHGHVQVRLTGDPIPEVRLGAVEHHWVHNPIYDRPCPPARAYSTVHVWATHGAHYRDCPQTCTRPIDMDVLSHLSPDDRIRMQRFMSGACSVEMNVSPSVARHSSPSTWAGPHPWHGGTFSVEVRCPCPALASAPPRQESQSTYGEAVEVDRSLAPDGGRGNDRSPAPSATAQQETPNPDPSPQDVQVIQHKLQTLLSKHGAGTVIGTEEAAQVLRWQNTGRCEEIGRQLLSWIQSQCAAMDAGESVRQSLLKEFEDSIKDIWAPPGGQKLGGSEEPFFQQQEGRHCGMHALNNILGGNVVTPTDMMEGAEAYLSEQGHGTGDTLQDLVAPDGNYSSEALAYVLRDKGYSLDLSEPAAANLERAKGFLQHRPRAHHWIAYRYCAGAIWRLDSLKERPEQITGEELVKELSENRTFAIHAIVHG